MDRTTPLPSPLPSPRPSLDVPVLVNSTRALLRAGVPLTLLLDVAAPDGPRSERRYADEGADQDWRRR